MTTSIETVFRDYVTDGVPASGAHEPIKSDIRDLLNEINDNSGEYYIPENLVEGDSVTAAQAETNRAAIQAKIDLASANSFGGVVLIPPGVYKIGENASTEVSLQTYSNVHLMGYGRHVSTLKLHEDTDTCHLLIMSGASGSLVTNCSCSKLTFDGNRQNRTSGVGGHVIRAQWIQYVDLMQLSIKNSAGYGLGFQAGSIQDLLVSNVLIDNTASDGIDFKNAENTNEKITLENVQVVDWGQVSDTQAAIDLRGGVQCSGLDIRMTQGATTDHVGLRFREAGGGTVGDGADKSKAVNVFCDFTGGTVSSAVYVACDDVSIVNLTKSGSAVRGLQVISGVERFSLVNADLSDGTYGIEDSSSNASFVNVNVNDSTGEAYRINASDEATFTNCACFGCYRGFREINTPTNIKYINCNPNSTNGDWLTTTDQVYINPQNFTTELFLFNNGCVQASLGDVANCTNYMKLSASNGGPPVLSAQGTSTNLDLVFDPKGAGTMRFGVGTSATTPASFSADNYMTMKLRDGTVILVPYMTAAW